MVEARVGSPQLEELEAYYSMLPAGFREKLHFGRTGIPGDFVNNYAGLHAHLFVVIEESDSGNGVLQEDVDAINDYISKMISYREYLTRLIGNVMAHCPGITVNVEELIGKLMDIPGVLELEANIVEIKKLRFQNGPEFFNRMMYLGTLISVGVDIIKDRVTEDKVRKMFPM